MCQAPGSNPYRSRTTDALDRNLSIFTSRADIYWVYKAKFVLTNFLASLIVLTDTAAAIKHDIYINMYVYVHTIELVS